MMSNFTYIIILSLSITLSGASLVLSVCKDALFVLDGKAWITFMDIRFEMGASTALRISNSSHIGIDHCEIHGCAREGQRIRH